MQKIGLLSDTHGALPSTIFEFFSQCDEIWHAGDIGDKKIADKLMGFKPLRAVYGNIDGTDIRQLFPEYQVFLVEDVKVLMIHIGGYPGHYNKIVLSLIQKEKPKLFICGHSHILKVLYDQKNSLLHINPGAAGNNGWHTVITYARFIIDRNLIKELEIGELPRKSISADKQ